MGKILEIAQKWVGAGFAVIPIRFYDKRPDARLLPKDSEGSPIWEPFQKRLPSDFELKMWFPSDMHNIGLVMGWNNLVVIDFDIWDAYLLWQQMTGIQTYMVKTRRGMHAYFKINEPVRNIHNEFLDVKANGYVLIPPSIHPSRFVYEVYSDLPIAEVNSLRDVLPEFFMPAAPSHTEFPLPVFPLSQISDNPWEIISNPIQYDQDLINKIRTEHPITEFLTGLEQKSSDGRWWVALCPFHDDNHPSFWIDTQRQICGCHAGCTPKPLDVINLYAWLHGLTNRDAIFWMAKL